MEALADVGQIDNEILGSQAAFKDMLGIECMSSFQLGPKLTTQHDTSVRPLGLSAPERASVSPH